MQHDERGKRPTIDPDGSVHGSGSGAGGRGNPDEDYDPDPAAGGGSLETGGPRSDDEAVKRRIDADEGR
jgi:hypothetical protein